MKKNFLAGVALIWLTMAGCTSSRIVSSWKNPDSNQRVFKKVLVLGLMNNEERVLRVSMEDHLVADLKNLGYDAYCSCDEFSPKMFTGMNESEAVSKLRNSGFDAVLTVVLLDKVKERQYVPARVFHSPYVIYQRHFWGYYTTIYDRVYSPGYYETSTKYFWETNLYDLNNNRDLLYSVQTRSFDPSSAASLSNEYSRMLVQDMVKKDILVKQPVPVKAF